MVRVAFILLCHKDSRSIIEQARRLAMAGDYVSIHFDAGGRSSEFRAIREALADNPNICFAKKRVKCGWGAWSLVQASLNALQAAVDTFADATHFYMISGDCHTIKTAEYAHHFLGQHDRDYIESFDFFESDWIKTGMKEARLIYRHFFNERRQPFLFYNSFKLQRYFGLTRKIPADLQVMIGSQWWCLRRQTIEKILDFVKKCRDVLRFFSTTWIPDETFFQTLVRHVVPAHEIQTRPLTFLMFTDYGMPATFYNDHYDLLLSQEYLFARKISPEALDLKERLGRLYAETGREFHISKEGPKLFAFLTGKGREGLRFGRRVWEEQANIGRTRELRVVVCKKWHVAKRLLEQIGEEVDVASSQFLFHEHDAGLPDLGGTESRLPKRRRHVRSFLHMVFDQKQTDRLLICVDSASMDLIQDLYKDSAKIKTLVMMCQFNDAYLVGHAQRIGLVAKDSPPEVIERLLPTLRRDVGHEHHQLIDAQFPQSYQIYEEAALEENAVPLAEFLGISTEKARAILASDQLFSD